MSRISAGNKEKIASASTTHFGKSVLPTTQNVPPGIQSWQEPKHQLPPLFFFPILQLSCLSMCYCFTCLEIRNASALINGLKDDLSIVPLRKFL